MGKHHRKIGIMGGTFDPIHMGHLVMAEAVRMDYDLAKVLFIPTGTSPHKDDILITPAIDRYIMTMMATYSNPYFFVSPIERNLQEENHHVLKTLACPPKGRRAIVTIVNTKGSVPRKPGAKMIVEEDGTIIGSIGGGCSESEIRLVALEVISTGQYRTHHIDLTGNIAEEEGMVCGGIMDVLIEPFD